MANSSSLKSRHEKLIKTYKGITDHDIIKNNFEFIRDEERDEKEKHDNWEIRMSISYYQQLFREYALADLSRYKEGKIGLRWRTESEVVSGKGQFICGNKKCSCQTHLHSYEILFAYVENKEKKRCLVKVRACPECALKLFYKKLKKKRKKIPTADVPNYIQSVREPIAASSSRRQKPRNESIADLFV